MVLLSLIIFAIGFITTASTLQQAATVFAILPALASAGLLGLLTGLLVTAACLLVGLPLLFIALGFPLLSIVTDLGSLASILGSLAICLMTGTIRDMMGRMRQLRVELEMQARLDPLTNLLNRRALLEMGERELKRATRLKKDITYYLGTPEERTDATNAESAHKARCTVHDYLGTFSCALVNVDLFHRINQTYGHAVGDQVLEHIGKLMSHQECLRESDIAGRFADRDFVVLLTGTSARNAVHPMERLRTTTQSHTFRDATGATFSVTISCGISHLREGDKNLEDILHRAQIALTIAKERGRNRVVVFEEVPVCVQAEHGAPVTEQTEASAEGNVQG